MAQENEVVMLALGVGVLAFALKHRKQLARVPHWRLLFLAYRILLVAWTATVLEGFFLPTALNLLEHAGYAAAATLIALWCWRAGLGGASREAGC